MRPLHAYPLGKFSDAATDFLQLVPRRGELATQETRAYLFFTDVITGGFLLAANHYDEQTLWRVLVTIPFLLVGIWLGTCQFLKTPSTSFKALVMWLLLGFCTVGIIQLL